MNLTNIGLSWSQFRNGKSHWSDVNSHTKRSVWRMKSETHQIFVASYPVPGEWAPFVGFETQPWVLQEHYAPCEQTDIPEECDRIPLTLQLDYNIWNHPVSVKKTISCWSGRSVRSKSSMWRSIYQRSQRKHGVCSSSAVAILSLYGRNELLRDHCRNKFEIGDRSARPILLYMYAVCSKTRHCSRADCAKYNIENNQDLDLLIDASIRASQLSTKYKRAKTELVDNALIRWEKMYCSGRSSIIIADRM